VSADLQPGQSAFAAAVQWLEGTLLGSLAMAIAVIAVACVGLLLLSGRIDVRRGAQVIFGCFILFGASSIAAGMMRIVGDENAPAAVTPAPAPPSPVYVPPAATTPIRAVPYDPYAGAALPTRP
jgi:type IV secretion system protein VirB2